MKLMEKKTILLILSFLLFFSSHVYYAGASLEEKSVRSQPLEIQKKDKKLIEYGWDVPYVDFVEQNIREMEEKPFNGIIFRLHDFDYAFDTRSWDEATLKLQLRSLARIQWGSFTDNFLFLFASNKFAMDWFNDVQWQIIMSNLKLMAKAAKVGQCKGVALDPEGYSGKSPWKYPGEYKDKSFEEMEAQVRKRGAQFIGVFQQEFPDMVLLTFFQLSEIGIAPNDAPGRQEELKKNNYALLPAFLNGMLDAVAPNMHIVDGCENSYYNEDFKDYADDVELIKKRTLAWISPENHEKYLSHVQAGMALYMDQVLGLRESPQNYISYFLSPKEKLLWFEHNVYYA